MFASGTVTTSISVAFGVIPPTAELPVNVTKFPTDNPCAVCETVTVALLLVTVKGFDPNECVLSKALNVTELPPPAPLPLALSVKTTV